jgi:hypothetical protein
VVVFGGFADKRFLGDIAVYDVGKSRPPSAHPAPTAPFLLSIRFL